MSPDFHKLWVGGGDTGHKASCPVPLPRTRAYYGGGRHTKVAKIAEETPEDVKTYEISYVSYREFLLEHEPWC